MLERYYIRPVTVDRVRTSWIAPAIEQYVGWLAAVFERLCGDAFSLVAFGDFAKRVALPRSPSWRARRPFVQAWIARHARRKRAARARKRVGEFAQNIARQMPLGNRADASVAPPAH